MYKTIPGPAGRRASVAARRGVGGACRVTDLRFEHTWLRPNYRQPWTRINEIERPPGRPRGRSRFPGPLTRPRPARAGPGGEQEEERDISQCIANALPIRRSGQKGEAQAHAAPLRSALQHSPDSLVGTKVPQCPAPGGCVGCAHLDKPSCSCSKFATPSRIQGLDGLQAPDADRVVSRLAVIGVASGLPCVPCFRTRPNDRS